MATVGACNMKLNVPNELIYIAGGFLINKYSNQINNIACSYLDYKYKQNLIKMKEDERPINIMGDLI